jgi:hypothetical protein
MKERIHEQLSRELKQASRMDTTVTIIAIVVTFILFGMSYGFANFSVGYSYTIQGFNAPTVSLKAYAVAAMFVGLIAILVINLYSIFAIRNNTTKKAKLSESLAKLYQEEGVTVYSVEDMMSGYKARRNLFTAILATIGAIGIIVPLIMFIHKVVEEL